MEQRTDHLDHRRAIDELLRFVSPVQLTRPRFALHTTELAGAALRARQTLKLQTGCAATMGHSVLHRRANRENHAIL